MINEKVDQAVFEKLIELAVIENHTKELAAIPSVWEPSTAYTFSNSFESRMKKILSKYRKKIAFSHTLHFTRKAAAFIIIFLGISFGFLLSAPNVRAAVSETIIQWYDKYTRFSFSNVETVGENTGVWRPEYLPAGFFEESVLEVGPITNITYKNANESLIVLTYAPIDEGYSFSIDNEHTLKSDILIGGEHAYLFKANTENDESYLIWEKEGISFQVQSTVHYAELIKMAESVIKK